VLGPWCRGLLGELTPVTELHTVPRWSVFPGFTEDLTLLFPKAVLLSQKVGEKSLSALDES